MDERIIELAQKQESNLTEQDKNLLKGISDKRIIEYLVTLNLDFIKYLSISEYLDISNYIIANSQKEKINEIADYLNGISMLRLINQNIKIDNDKIEQLIEKYPKIIDEINENVLNEALVNKALENGYHINSYSPEMLKQFKYIKHAIEKGQSGAIYYLNFETLTEEEKQELLLLAIDNGYEIRIHSPKIIKQFKYIKHAIEKGQGRAIDYLDFETLTEEEKQELDRLIQLAIDNGYEIDEDSPKMLKQFKYIKHAIEKGQGYALDYLNFETLTEEENQELDRLIHLAIDNGCFISKDSPEILKQFKYAKHAIEKGQGYALDYLNFETLTEKEKQELGNSLLLSIDNGYEMQLYHLPSMLKQFKYVKHAIEKGQGRVLCVLNIETLTEEEKQELDKLIPLAIDNGYYIDPHSPKIIKQFKYIKYAIEKGQIDTIKYLQQEEITETIIKESIKKRFGEKKLKEELEKLLNYINTVTNKQFANIEEFIHKNEDLYQMLLDLGKYAILNPREYTEEAFNKFKELIKVTRIMGMNLDLNSLLQMDTNLIKQYKSKIWKKLSTHRIFSRDENTKKALIEIIGVFGLFNNDKIKADINLDILNKLINKIPNRFTKEEYESILYANKVVIATNQNIENIEELLRKVPGKKYKLKSDAEIPGILSKYEDYFDDELNEKQYQFLKKLVPTGRTGSEMNKFLKTAYEEIEEEYYELDPTKLNIYNMNKLLKLILPLDLNGELTFNSIHRLFDGMKQEYNEEFFEFLVENFEMILLDKKHQSDLKQIQKEFEIIKQKSTQDKLTYQFVVDYLENVQFEHIKVGNETLAKKVKNAGVNSQEAYEYYQSLYEDASKIKYTSLPNYEQEFEMNYNGRPTRFRTRRLRKNDPLLLLVGESHYTNCCQIHGNAGQECNKHSAQSQNGGVFVTEIFKDGKWILMTQSWDWVNDGVYCHDNIEGTDLYKKSPELRDIVATLYKNHAESIMEISKTTTEEYLKQHSNLSQEQLEIVKKQIIQLVTVGLGCDDLGVSHYFKKQVEHPRGPKKYESYRDSHTQYIITGNESDLIDSVTEDELYLYRELRQIKIEYSENISSFTLKMIDDIEKEQNIPEDKKTIIKEYDKELDNYTQKLKNENQIIISGEDWYLAYEENEIIKIEDLKIKQPRLEDEKEVQIQEILEIIKNLINENTKIEMEINETSLSIYKELLTGENMIFEEKNNSVIITNSNHIDQKSIKK